MNLLRLICTIGICCLLNISSANAQGGGCGCTNCPQFMPDNFVGDFLINVIGATDNDLSDPTQGICEIKLNFDHQYIGDLFITLTSPFGQSIGLVGSIGLSGESDLSTWNISFLPCGVTPMPDVGYPNGLFTWENSFLTRQNFDFVGSYHPINGCLEDFDTGPVNGTWTLTVTDGQAIDVGTFIDYEIIFCNDEGINCNSNPCGVFASAEAPSFACQGDTIVIDASASAGNTFVWGTDDGEFVGTPSGPIVEVVESGTYFVTVSNNGSCPEVATVIFNTVPEVPAAEITVSDVLDCDNTEITLQGATDITEDLFVNWIEGFEVDPDNFNPLSTDLDLTIDEPGTYTLIVVNTESACSQTATITIEDESELPVIETEVLDSITCLTDNVNIAASSDIAGSTFNWSGPDDFSDPSSSTTVTEPGEYNIIVTAPNGCIDSATVVVASDTIPPMVALTASNELDCTITSADLAVNTTDSITSISWTGPDGYSNDVDLNPSVVLGGTYTLVASTANGCVDSATVEVIQNADLPDIFTVDDGTITCINSGFELFGGSTSSNATFLWEGPNGFNINDTDAGIVSDTGLYTLTVFSDNGCSITSEVFVDADTTQPILSIDTPELLGCTNMNTTLTISTAEPNLIYDWSGPNGQSYDIANPEINGPGPYDLIVTGENGCTNTFSVMVMSDETPPDVDVSIMVDDIITCNNLEANVINNNNDPTFTYAWTGPNGFTSSSDAPMLTEEGLYTLIVTGANGCTAQQMVTAIEETDEPDIDFTTNEITCMDEIVSIGVSSSENIVGYAWTGESGYTSTVQNPDDIDEAGEYTVVITAENGCSNSVTFDVTENDDAPDGLVTFADGITLDCNLTSLLLEGSTATPNATLQWQDPLGIPIAGDNIMADMIGVYTLTVTGENGCTQPLPITINEDLSGPEITDNPNVDLFCTGGATLAVTANENIVSYAWTGPNGFTSSDTNPNVDAEGLYEVIVTGANGCTNTSSVQVADQQTPPSIFVDPTQTLVCGQSQLIINGGSNDTNTTLSWSTMGGSIISATTGTSIAINAQGTYLLTVTNTTTGCTETAEVQVGQDMNSPIADITAAQTTIDCNTFDIVLNAEGSDNGSGFDFVWGNTGGTDLTNESTLQASIAEAGTYFITITNTDNQCTSIASIEIDEDNDDPLIELSDFGMLDCNTSTINIENISDNGSANLIYDWQASAGGNISSANDATQIEVDMPGTYSLILTNTETGCTSDFTFDVMDDIVRPDINAGDNLTLDCGVNSLGLTGSISSSEPNLSILWTSDNGIILSGEDTLEPEVGSASTYVLTVTNNDNGCTSTSEVTVEANQELPIVAFESAPDFSCGTSSLILDASTSTSGTGITYQWTNDEGKDIFNDDTPNPEIFEAGEYTLTIINTTNGCESSSSITIGADTLAPNLVLDPVDELSCIVKEVNLGVSSDVAGLDLQWSAITGNIVSGETTPTPLVNQAGEYELTVTDINNQCTASTIVIVMLDEDSPVVEIVSPEELTCINQELTLDATNSTEGNNISISWDMGDGNIVSGEDGLTPTVDMPGTYTLTISDDTNGCSVSQSVEITENMIAPEVIVDTPDMLNCNNRTISVQALNQGASDYTYSWTTTNGNIVDGEDSLSPNIDQEGDYVLVATDINNGCTSTLDIMVEEDITEPDLLIGNTYEITCVDEIVSIDGMGSSEGPQFTYSWTDENGSEIETDLAIDLSSGGTFSLEITNVESGCSNMASITIDDIRQLPEVEIMMPETITCTDPIVQLVANDMNNLNLEYIWEDAQGNVLNTNPSDDTIDVDQEGTYELTVVNPANGCESSFTVNVQANQQIPDVSVSAANNAIVDCDNPTLNLTGALNGLDPDQVEINWTTVNGNFVADQNTLNPEVNAAGTYQLEITDISNGCMNSAEVIISQDADLPLASLNDPGELNCNIDFITLVTPVSGGNIELTWTLDGEIIPGAITNELIADQPGDYMVLISNTDNGCSSFDQVTIEQDIEAPMIDAGGTFELQCDTPEYELTATLNGNGNFDLMWDAGTGNIVDGETTLNPTVDQAGTYTLNVKNTDNGCSSTDVTTITVNDNVPLDLFTEVQDPQCVGDLGTISNLEVIGGEGPFLFSIDGGNTFTDETLFTELESGTYQIEAIDANGCPISQMATIAEPLDIAVDLVPEIEIIIGDSAQLAPNLTNIDPNDIQTIEWTPSAGLSCDDCLFPTTTSTLDILYTLEITLGSGCSVLDDIQLRIDRDLSVYAPNAFSPFNLDGINDVFYLFAKEDVVTNINRFSIFDRWGNEVFFRENILPNDPTQGWDGIFRGEEMSIGVYVYYMEIEFRNGNTEILKGDVLLEK